MKKIKSTNLVLIILVISISFLMNACTKKAPEGVVATVNKEDITVEEFNKEYEIRTNTINSRLDKEGLEVTETEKQEVKDEVLNIYIIEKLIIQDAIEDGIQVEDKEVENKIEAIRDKIGGEEGLKDYKESLGMDDEYFRNFIKRDILIEKHKKSYMESLELSEKEIKKTFKENKKDLIHIKARQILVETQEEGKELLTRLKNGGDFKALAIENSIDVDTALEGGELGYFPKGANPKEFDEIIFQLNKGDISPLIKTDLGYHIVEVQEVKDSLESLKEETADFAREKEYIKYLKKLEENAKVEIYTNEIHKEEEEENG